MALLVYFRFMSLTVRLVSFVPLLKSHETCLTPPHLFACQEPRALVSQFCVWNIFTLCFRCVVCFLLYLSVNSHYYKTCHGTFLSQTHIFGFDVIFVILIGFCLMLSPFQCVLHFNVVLLLYLMRFPQF